MSELKQERKYEDIIHDWFKKVDELKCDNEHMLQLLKQMADSGILCDPGCCGDCCCDKIREFLNKRI